MTRISRSGARSLRGLLPYSGAAPAFIAADR